MYDSVIFEDTPTQIVNLGVYINTIVSSFEAVLTEKESIAATEIMDNMNADLVSLLSKNIIKLEDIIFNASDRLPIRELNDDESEGTTITVESTTETEKETFTTDKKKKKKKNKKKKQEEKDLMEGIDVFRGEVDLRNATISRQSIAIDEENGRSCGVRNAYTRNKGLGNEETVLLLEDKTNG